MQEQCNTNEGVSIPEEVFKDQIQCEEAGIWQYSLKSKSQICVEGESWRVETASVGRCLVNWDSRFGSMGLGKTGCKSEEATGIRGRKLIG